MTFAQLVINASGEPIDGTGELWEVQVQTELHMTAGVLYAVSGSMRFDSADLVAMETRGVTVRYYA